ncbi:hypothetical protein [Microbacterium sp. NPDC089696]|uniref:hypothetical protein n=1 Tax=Microbacterium sp. NPDC089696 TaxID=3364199 RepID=UPI0037F95AD9
MLASNDPFVSILMRSDHVNAVRQRGLADLRSGELSSGVNGRPYDRDISNNGFVLLNDVINVLSSPLSGPADPDSLHARNLPESFLVSYHLDVFASEPAPDGAVEVTYVINNDTTTDSLTRIPMSGGAHLPVASSALLSAEADSGDWASQHQTIAWPEKVYP